MTPEEKANELIVKFAAHAAGSTGDQNWINAKNCAIIAVEEILNTASNKIGFGKMAGFNNADWSYWYGVKNHLNQM